MSKRDIAAMAIVVVVAITGCTSSSPTINPTVAARAASEPSLDAAASPSADAASPSAGASSNPTPAVLTVDQAAAAYLAIAKPYNKTIKAAYRRWGKGRTLRAQKKYWAALAKADDTFIDGLKLIAFPPEVQADATALLKAAIVEQRRDLSASKAKSLGALYSLVASANKANDAAADRAAILRDDLGLPPNS